MQNFDEADLNGMQALAYRTLADFDPSAAVHAQVHAKQAITLRTEGHERSTVFDYLSLASACFIAGDPDQADAWAQEALRRIGQTSSHRTWDRLRQMYTLSGRYAGQQRIRELRREIEAVMPPGRSRNPGRGEPKNARSTKSGGSGGRMSV